MRHLLLIGAVSAVLAAPAIAQEETDKSLMEQGAELFFEGLRKEMEPALDELLGVVREFGPAMQSFFEEMGPALSELAGEIQDWSVYDAPEMLPNGDIIIRRKPTEDPEDEPLKSEDPPEGATDI